MYSRRLTTNQRKAEAVKRKLDPEFVAPSSSDSAKKGNSSGQKKKKRKIDHAKQTQLSHQKMCTKAVDTMEAVKAMVTKVEKYIDENKKKLQYKILKCTNKT